MMTHRFVVPGQRLIAVVLLLSLVCLPLQAADVKEVKLDKAQQEAVDKLRAKGAAVMQIAADTDALAVNLGILGKQATDEDLAQVAKLPKVQQLDLHNTAVTDAGLSAIADLTTLTHLHLNGTAVTDAGLAHLKKLTALEYLNLYNTAVTDAGLKHLEGLKSLQKLYLWQTKVTDAGAKSLKSAVPAVVINRGEELALPPPPPPEDPKTAAKPDDKKPDAKKPAAGKGPDIDEEGFLRTWLVLGPFPIEGAAGEEIDASQLPNEGKLSPKAGEKVKVNDKDLAWKSTKADDYFLDFNELFDASGQDNVGVYAVAFVNAAKEVKDVTLLMGSNDQGKVYLNGKELAKFTSGRSLEKDSEEAKGLTLNKGMNTVVLKVINESNNWQGCVRLVDKAGKPVQGLTLATPGDEKKPEAKPAEKKPEPAKKPAEKKPANAKPAAKPAEKKPAEAKPAEKKPAEKKDEAKQ